VTEPLPQNREDAIEVKLLMRLDVFFEAAFRIILELEPLRSFSDARDDRPIGEILGQVGPVRGHEPQEGAAINLGTFP
jgi:hypothetical protein